MEITNIKNDTRRAKVIAVVNQKGGVGKTTIVRECGGTIAALNPLKVLLIDCDSQANLTTSLLDPDILIDSRTGAVRHPTLAHVLNTPLKGAPQQQRVPIEKTIIHTRVTGLDIIAGSEELANFDREPDFSLGRLSAAITPLRASYDLILLDCPPALGRLQTEALRASDYALIPCIPAVIGLEGLERLHSTITQIKEGINPPLEILGVVINMFKPRRAVAKESRQVIMNARHLFGRIFETNIHDYTEITEAPREKLPVFYTARSSPASKMICDLCNELLVSLGMREPEAAVVEAAETTSSEPEAHAASTGSNSLAHSTP